MNRVEILLLVSWAAIQELEGLKAHIEEVWHGETEVQE